MDKASLIDGRFALGQPKPGVELAFYELHKRGLFKKLKMDYEMVMTLDSHALSKTRWESESKWLQNLSQMVTLHYKLNHKVVTVGGDHSIGLSTVTGVVRANPNIALVWVDAHADYNTVETSVTGNLHGMPLNGIVNGWKSISPVFEWIGEGILDASRIALFGLRDVDVKEQILLDYSGIPYWTMNDIRQRGVHQCLKELTLKINPHQHFDWHVSFDLDSIDPSEFPSTGCLVPGGITFDESLEIMGWFNEGNLLKSFDIVEWNPQIAATSDCDEKLIKLINQGL